MRSERKPLSLFYGLFLLLVLATGAAGCESNENRGKPEAAPATDLWTAAQSGRLPGVSVGIGATKRETIEALGQPDRSGYAGTSYRLEYGQTWLDFDVDVQKVIPSLDQLPEDAVVEGITSAASVIPFDGTTSDVEQQWGYPQQAFVDEAYGPFWKQVYQVSDYRQLTFLADAEHQPIRRINLMGW
ncbi:hypothetical protein [Gorillibacterium sp. sgz500922]|uniref:hypothetical protein n=1 Tax=Gorillibacterium sp. sgz500922 TaxID=3446694 RepID=UPI003F668401